MTFEVIKEDMIFLSKCSEVLSLLWSTEIFFLTAKIWGGKKVKLFCGFYVMYCRQLHKISISEGKLGREK